MSSLCWECKYEHSDCKGDKWIEKAKCDYFSKKDAINYPQRIRELEGLLEQADKSYDILIKENEMLIQQNANERKLNEALVLRADKFEAENKELKFEIEKYKEHIKSLDEIILKLKDESSKLKAENNKLQQWTLNDRKVRHGFELAIETLKKCKECDTE